MWKLLIRSDNLDKVILKFIADVLYIKGALCFEEFEAIMDACNFSDLDKITEKMLSGEYNVYKRGESYHKDGRIV